jgi:radical SAM superfamily enzyme YgiQ (UPF0313 family)
VPSIYIINPAPDGPSYHTGEAYQSGDGPGWVPVADLASVTVAALVPADWAVRITDEAVDPVDYGAAVDFVAITGKVTQRRRMYAIASEFRQRGRTVLIGGPFASLNPEDVEGHADILVTGELEDLAPRLFADLAAGRWAARYDGEKADLDRSPLPRWDLYPLARASLGAIQTSRGCPFDCEFCDVIQYLGRKQRHKSIARVCAELDQLHVQGVRQVFLVDDNFTVARRRAQALVEALAEWNEAHEGDRVRFLTQASIDVARNSDLLSACAAAGLTDFYVGIETVNVESLRETRKRQNLLQPLRPAIETILAHGIGVRAAIVTGFDHDEPDIFARLFEALQSLPLPDVNVNCLMAPRRTPLHARLQAEGRLTGELWDGAWGGPFTTNIIPARMSADELIAGTTWLSQALCEPKNFHQRMANFIAALGVESGSSRRSRRAAHSSLPAYQSALRRLIARGPAEATMVSDVLRLASRKPGALPLVAAYLGQYEQFRQVLDGVPREVRGHAVASRDCGHLAAAGGDRHAVAS